MFMYLCDDNFQDSAGSIARIFGYLRVDRDHERGLLETKQVLCPT